MGTVLALTAVCILLFSILTRLTDNHKDILESNERVIEAINNQRKKQ